MFFNSWNSPGWQKKSRWVRWRLLGGLTEWEWPNLRLQQSVWTLDGAHTPDSLQTRCFLWTRSFFSKEIHSVDPDVQSYKTSGQTASRDCMLACNVFLNSTFGTTTLDCTVCTLPCSFLETCFSTAHLEPTLDRTVCMLPCNMFLNSTVGRQLYL